MLQLEVRNVGYIIQLDNAAFHPAKKLEVPANIILLFQPPYSPELNPGEEREEGEEGGDYTNSLLPPPPPTLPTLPISSRFEP